MRRQPADAAEWEAENARLRARVAELERAAGLADAIIAGLPGLLVILDEQGRFVEWSRRDYGTVLGHPPLDSTADGFPDVHPDDRQAVNKAVADAMAGLEGSAEARVFTRQGPRWFALRGRSCIIGGKRYVVATGTDIEQAKQAEAGLRTALRRLGMLARMAATAVGRLTLKELARRFAIELRETFDVDGCVIRILDGDELDLLVAEGMPDGVLAQRIPVYGIAQRMFETGEPVVITDALSDPVTRDLFSPRPGSLVFRSYAGVPLLFEHEKLGVLGLFALHETREFTPADVEHLTIVASTVAIVLRNERLFDTVRSQQRELELWAKELEWRVEERTRELEATVAELEAFSYSVSHDLRSPIRAMVGYAHLLEEEHAAELGADARRFIGSIKSSAVRLGGLVDDLLEFSRVGRRAIERAAVFPREVVDSVLAEETPNLSGRTVEITIGDLPPCHADAGLLRQVYQNLIGNAIKYTSKREHACIEIGATQTNGQVTYFVRDNGIGFDPRYADRMFGVFQRLVSDEEFEGTGVGLAIVQRILHRHGGEVWATSTPGQGATFYFTIGAQAGAPEA